MDPPGTTYRLQFNHGFRFVDGRDLVPYLSDLGITDLYSSPRTRRGAEVRTATISRIRCG